MFFYFPRICNHCLNPSCVASCPSGALYKRGEDGIVLIDQERCRGWRSCIAACPYKKTYYNWQTGKSEKCILCFPRLETGQAPACFHSCVGRIRYLGVLLYDADKIEETAKKTDLELVDAHRDMILNPHDPDIIKAARKNGIADDVIKTAQKSPVYKFVKEWGIALPPHIEFRTLPMLFYVPAMLPVMASFDGQTVKNLAEGFFPDFDQARVPMEFLGNLFAAGNTAKVRYALKKQMAVRQYRRAVTVGDVKMEAAEKMLIDAGSSVEEAEEIYKLTSLCTFDDRFVIPPAHREEAIQMIRDPLEHKQSVGFGFREEPVRGA
ncbi:MAG: 4Fe-4S dicluster domain-containing protein [bacterium]